MLSQKCTEEEAKNLCGSTFTLGIATTFGQTERFSVTVEEHFQKPSPDIMHEPVANILRNALLRCITLSSMSSPDTDDKEPLQCKVSSLLESLGMESTANSAFLDLCRKGSGALGKKEEIVALLDKVLVSITDKVVQDAKKSRFRFGPWSLLKAPLSSVTTVFLLPFFFLGLAPIIFAIKRDQVEEDYLSSLRFICRKVRTVNEYFGTQIRGLEAELKALDAEEDKELREAQAELDRSSWFWFQNLKEREETKKEIRGKRNHKKVMLAEQLLLYHIAGHPDLEDTSFFQHLNFFRRKIEDENTSWLRSSTSKDIYSNLDSVLNSVRIFRSIHVIRLLYSKQCYMGFVGPQNAGKSTLLNKLFGRSAETGYRTHTAEPTRYKVGENIVAVDFPGLDSLKDHRSRFAEFGHMNNFFIYLMPYDGSPSEKLVENVRIAYAMQKDASCAAKTLFCINKCGASTGTDSFNEDYKSDFVAQIKAEIDRTEFEPSKEGHMKKLFSTVGKETSGDKLFKLMNEIKEKEKEVREYILKHLTANDFMFTDLMNPDPARGIMGSKEVKKVIKGYLTDMQIFTKEGLDGLF